MSRQAGEEQLRAAGVYPGARPGGWGRSCVPDPAADAIVRGGWYFLSGEVPGFFRRYLSGTREDMRDDFFLEI